MSVDLIQSQIDNDYVHVALGDYYYTQFGGAITTISVTQDVVDAASTESVINGQQVLLYDDTKDVYFRFNQARLLLVDVDRVNIVPPAP